MFMIVCFISKLLFIQGLLPNIVRPGAQMARTHPLQSMERWYVTARMSFHMP